MGRTMVVVFFGSVWVKSLFNYATEVDFLTTCVIIFAIQLLSIF